MTRWMDQCDTRREGLVLVRRLMYRACALRQVGVGGEVLVMMVKCMNGAISLKESVDRFMDASVVYIWQTLSWKKRREMVLRCVEEISN